jgi:hypothetical protein
LLAAAGAEAAGLRPGVRWAATCLQRPRLERQRTVAATAAGAKKERARKRRAADKKKYPDQSKISRTKPVLEYNDAKTG